MFASTIKAPEYCYFIVDTNKEHGGIKLRTTYMAHAGKVERKWYVIDAADIELGRLASVVASILRGKNKPTYTPNVDTGDNVVIVNASKVKLSGRKADEKVYYHHSAWIGHMKSMTAGKMRATKPTHLIELAVKGMLPHNSLGHYEFLKMHVYAGPKHENQAQEPVKLDISKLI